jgi:hypothetical protein
MHNVCNQFAFMTVQVQIGNVPDSVHSRINEQAALDGKSLSEWLLREITTLANRPSPKEFLVEHRAQWNSPIAITGAWRGKRDRFIQRYRSGMEDNLGYEFDAPFAAVEWTGPDCCDIDWMRHTGS